jgi:hypothetical protein
LANGDGGFFNFVTNAGQDTATWELVSAMPDVILDDEGNDLGALLNTGDPVLLAITSSDFDADPDENGIRDTVFEGMGTTNPSPLAGQCLNTANGDNSCGTEEGSFTLLIPEPTTVALFGIGLVGAGFSSLRRRRSA